MASIVNKKIIHAPSSIAERKIEKEMLLVQLIKQLKTRCWFERSCKFSQKKLIINRFVYTFKKSNLGQNAEAKILFICERLNMPISHVDSLRQIFPKLEYILFGYEEGETTSGYKIYVEFQVDKKSISTLKEPLVGAIGYKWDAFDNKRHVVSQYTWYPFLTVEKMCERIANIYDPQTVPFAVAKKIIERAAGKINWQDIMYLEVADENTPRKSFDLNIYDAGYQLKDFYPILLRILRYYSIQPEVCRRLYEQMCTIKFGHIAGGSDKDGQDFFSIYCGHNIVRYE